MMAGARARITFNTSKKTIIPTKSLRRIAGSSAHRLRRCGATQVRLMILRGARAHRGTQSRFFDLIRSEGEAV